MLAVRISRSYVDISSVLIEISRKSEGACWYEHDADEEVSRQHVHGLLVNPTISTDTMKGWLRKILGPVDRYDWAFPTTYKNDLKEVCAVNMDFITYMSKGKLEPVHCYGSIHSLLCDVYRKKWVERSKRITQTEQKIKEKTHWDLIQEILTESHKIPGAWCNVLERQDGELVTVQGLSDAGRADIFDLMCQVLNKNKVRTSRNELERFYVSIIRHDNKSRENMRISILQNVFRTQ